jgi:hypothetical protein
MLFNGKGMDNGWTRYTAAELSQLIVDTQIERFGGTIADANKIKDNDEVHRFVDNLNTMDYDQDKRTDAAFKKIKALIVLKLTEKLTP